METKGAQYYSNKVYLIKWAVACECVIIVTEIGLVNASVYVYVAQRKRVLFFASEKLQSRIIFQK